MGGRPVRSGSSIAVTRAAQRVDDCASAPRNASSESASAPAWKFAFGRMAGSPGAISGFSAAAFSSTASTRSSAVSASRAVPST